MQASCYEQWLADGMVVRQMPNMKDAHQTTVRDAPRISH
jgi:hypothetical protein